MPRGPSPVVPSCVLPSTPSQPMMPPSSPSCARPASLLPPPAPSSSRLTHPVDTSLSAVPATRSSHPSASRAAIDATPVCREGTHACREMEGGVVARMQKRPRPLLPPPRQPPLFPGQNRLTCTCQAQNAKTRRRRPRARSARCAAPAVTTRGSPDPTCTGTSAHRSSTRAGPRSLQSSAWSGVALTYCRLPEKGTMLSPGAPR